MPCLGKTHLINFYTLKQMETLLVFAIAEIAVASTVSTLQLKAQETILAKWREGSLTLDELNVLKTRRWFQRRVLKPPKDYLPRSKKTD